MIYKESMSTNKIISTGNGKSKNKDNDFIMKYKHIVSSELMSKSKKKISPEDFIVPEFHEYDWLAVFNYNLKQLKEICKKYKVQSSGCKNDLLVRLYVFLFLSNKVISLQRHVRGMIVRRLNRLKGNGLLKRDLCVNETDFYTLDDVKEIPVSQFFSFTDTDKKTYGFDIISLYNLILKDGHDTKNPYNRQDIPKDTITNIRNVVRISKILKIHIDIKIKNENVHTPAQRTQMRIIALFQAIDSLGNYSQSQWFSGLDRRLLIRYLRELSDIWMYRAQLTNEVKMQICPPNGDPFRNTNMNLLMHNMGFTDLQRFCLTVMENLVNSGSSAQWKSLGAYYVLAALTLVNQNAANTLPWLYESVVHI